MQRGKEESAEGEGERTHRGGGGRADARGKKDVPLFYLNFILFSSRDFNKKYFERNKKHVE
jgi:hypothetical protein